MMTTDAQIAAILIRDAYEAGYNGFDAEPHYTAAMLRAHARGVADELADRLGF